MIYLENISDVFKPRPVMIWLASAFKAGFINSAGFLATGKFVSHVTGFGTQMGIAIGHEDYFFGVELMVIPLSFIFGGVITSLILDKNYKSGEYPPFFIVQALITLMIGLVICAGVGMELIKTPFDLDNKYSFVELFILSSLCFICGLKNSLVTWATFGKIRVTHLTGLSTDIGLNLIRTFKKNHPHPRMKENRIVNFVRILTFVSFSSGALISAIVIPKIGYKGFLVVFAISLVMTFISLKDFSRNNGVTENGVQPI
jgi:uncharacterized membrane protein YoaK (UPF0700 family)